MALVLRARATAELADALDADLDQRGAAQLLARRRAAAGRRAGPDGAGRDRRGHPPLRRHVRQPGRRGEGGRAGRVHDHRARVQPRLAQAAPGSPVHRAGPAQDQADQDRLHHGFRGADQPARADRPPGAGAPAAAPGRGPAQEHRGLADPDGGRGRPDPHHVQPDDRGHRPALVDRPEPAEHPDPDRGGPPDPAGLRGRRRLRDAAHRRLQPDRAAHHGRPVRQTPRWRRRSPPATTSTPRPRPGSSGYRPRRSPSRCAAGSRR